MSVNFIGISRSHFCYAWANFQAYKNNAEETNTLLAKLYKKGVSLTYQSLRYLA